MSASPFSVPMRPNANLARASAGQVDALGMGGLRSLDGRVFPLERVQVRTSIAGACAHTVIAQQFANPFDEALDVTWIFPLPGDGAIVSLELRAGDVVVVGECHTRDAARTQFADARADGFRAALLETEQRGVHTLSLAGLPARSAIAVHLTVVELLPITDGRFRFHFPLVLAPRYTPGHAVGHDGPGIAADTDAVPNASRLAPPLRIGGGTVLDLEVDIAGPVSALESSLHAVKLTLDGGGARIAPSHVTTLDRDFILEFSTAAAEVVDTRAYTDGAYTVVVVEPPTDLPDTIVPRDAVFAVDISGSMAGSKLDAAKAALSSALHGLRLGDRFRLLAFDDRPEVFHTDFLDYTDDNVQAADAWIAALEARGGTAMLEALQECFAGDTPPERLRTVLFITDGQSHDEARLLPAVANRRGQALLFTLGIDTAVNAALLRQLARVGGGVCELCTPSDDVDAVVARLEARFGSPVVSHLQVAHAARPEGHTVFHGRPAALLVSGAPDTVTVAGRTHTGALTAQVRPQRVQVPLGALWARERVSWLEERLALRPFEEEAIRPEIERIALEHRIASKFTSFVCVDRSVRVEGARRHVVQPMEMPDQWQLHASQPVVMRRMHSPAMPVMPVMPAPPSWPANAVGGRAAGASALDAISDQPRLSFVQRIEVLRKRVRTPDHSRPDQSRARSHPVHSTPPHPAPAAPTRRAELAGTLARTQGANGSYRNDIGRSAAALLALLLLGTTRHTGDRRRVVLKVARWLAQHRDDPRAALALEALETAEQSSLVIDGSRWMSLTREGPEGALLATLLG